MKRMKKVGLKFNQLKCSAVQSSVRMDFAPENRLNEHSHRDDVEDLGDRCLAGTVGLNR